MRNCSRHQIEEFSDEPAEVVLQHDLRIGEITLVLEPNVGFEPTLFLFTRQALYLTSISGVPRVGDGTRTRYFRHGKATCCQ